MAPLLHCFVRPRGPRLYEIMDSRFGNVSTQPEQILSGLSTPSPACGKTQGGTQIQQMQTQQNNPLLAQLPLLHDKQAHQRTIHQAKKTKHKKGSVQTIDTPLFRFISDLTGITANHLRFPLLFNPNLEMSTVQYPHLRKEQPLANSVEFLL